MKNELTNRNVQQWLSLARRDLEDAEALLSSPTPRLENAVFFSQQSAISSLKAFLAEFSVPSPIASKIPQLCSLCKSVDPTFSSLEQATQLLSLYEVRHQHCPEITQDVANELWQRARTVYELVEGAVS